MNGPGLAWALRRIGLLSTRRDTAVDRIDRVMPTIADPSIQTLLADLRHDLVEGSL